MSEPTPLEEEKVESLQQSDQVELSKVELPKIEHTPDHHPKEHSLEHPPDKATDGADNLELPSTVEPTTVEPTFGLSPVGRVGQNGHQGISNLSVIRDEETIDFSGSNNESMLRIAENDTILLDYGAGGDSTINRGIIDELDKNGKQMKLAELSLDKVETNQVRRLPGNEDLVFSTVTPTDQNVLMKMGIDELRKIVFFRQSDEDLLEENINILELENSKLREQIEDMEKDMDFKDR